MKKPRAIKVGRGRFAFPVELLDPHTLSIDGKKYHYGFGVCLSDYFATPAELKKLHKWLGRCLKYIEKN